MKHRPVTLVLTILVGALTGVLWWQLQNRPSPPPLPASAPETRETVSARPREAPPPQALLAAHVSRLAEIIAALATDRAREGEAVLSFANEAAYRRFLARAGDYHLRVLGSLDGLRVVRLGYDLPTDLDVALTDLGDGSAEIAANHLMYIPGVPALDPRDDGGTVPLGNRLLEFLGAKGDTSRWGSGVTIAIIDTGVSADPTFGQGRLRTLDLGYGILGNEADAGHGTAVAALAAGAAADAQGVAPGASLLSIRVTDAGGLADVFSVAQAITAAVDQGAQLVNISLGGYDTSTVLTRAIDYATQRGVVIVASAGNDQAAQLTWPAADPRVVSVGAVDGAETQVVFSNSGPQLQLVAPGYGVQTAWSDGSRVLFDGTSGSAPIVTGALAALMSQNSGMSAVQAAEVLRRYASDGGVPGADEDYGAGIVNLGWALSYHEPGHVDTAVSSHYYDPASDTVSFVVQNRSARGIGSLTLAINANGTTSQVRIPWLDSGGSQVITVPADGAAGAGAAGMTFRTELINPPGTPDAVPTNNVRNSRLQPPPRDDG